MKRSYEMDLCSGPLLSKILLFSLPLILSGVLQLLFNATDIVVVGKFAGSNAMAAVGSTTSLFNLLVNSFIGISVGANVLVARHYGERDYDGVQQTIQTALLTGLIGGTILIVLGVVLARPMLTLMATPDEVIDQAVLYMQVYFIGMPATMIYNFGAAVLRAVGDTRRPLYFLMAAGVMNVLGDLLFVCRLHFHMDKFLRIMQVGLPAGMQSVIFNISNVLIQSSVNSFGAVTVAGNTAASNIEGFVYISMNALYQTSISFTSQNLGAKNYHRIDQTLVRCMCIVTLIGLVLGNGAHLLGNHLLHIYSDDLEVISFGMQRLSVISVTYCLCGMMDVLAGTIRGLGYSMLPMIVSLIGACVFRIIWIFTVFRVQHTLFILYASYPISWILTILAHFVCYLIVRKKVFRPQEI